MLRHYFPEQGSNLQKKIAGNTFEDCSIGRKGFHGISFLGCFPNSLFRVLATD